MWRASSRSARAPCGGSGMKGSRAIGRCRELRRQTWLAVNPGSLPEINMSSPGPDDVNQLNDPAFQGWLKQLPQPIRPDGQDHDRYARAHTAVQQKDQYRLALDRKLLRLYQRWKAEQSQSQ